MGDISNIHAGRRGRRARAAVASRFAPAAAPGAAAPGCRSTRSARRWSSASGASPSDPRQWRTASLPSGCSPRPRGGPPRMCVCPVPQLVAAPRTRPHTPSCAHARALPALSTSTSTPNAFLRLVPTRLLIAGVARGGRRRSAFRPRRNRRANDVPRDALGGGLCKHTRNAAAAPVRPGASLTGC